MTRPVTLFTGQWADLPFDTACEKAKLKGKLFHDLRRTAVRDLIRAGVPQAVAMKITGHRTASVFTRYNIVSGDDMREAIRRTQTYRSSQISPRKVASMFSSKE